MVPSAPSASWAAVTVTVCAEFQFVELKVSDEGENVRLSSLVAPGLRFTVTLPDGAFVSFAV